MTTLFLTRGLPASGKTTWARALVASRRPGSIVRVNRDDLRRTMIDPAYSRPVPAVERRITDLQWLLVREALRDGIDVVVDDMNLRAGPTRRWRALAEACGAEVHVEHVDTDVEECVRRDRARTGAEHVGEATIRDDATVKLELFDAHVRPAFTVVAVFDDRDRVVHAWRAIGLTVLQVADGDF